MEMEFVEGERMLVAAHLAVCKIRSLDSNWFEAGAGPGFGKLMQERHDEP
jgi:hypothetical protein